MGRLKNPFEQSKYRGTEAEQKQNEIQQKMNKVYSLDAHIYICTIKG